MVGSDRAVGEVSIVDMATCGLHLGNGVVGGARSLGFYKRRGVYTAGSDGALKRPFIQRNF